MKVFRLKNRVKIPGRDFWGRRAEIVFDPVKSTSWSFGNNGTCTEITPDCLRAFRRRLTMFGSHGERRLEIGEHIFPIRFAGLVGVNVSGSVWPPYHGRTHEVFQALKPELLETEEDIPVYAVKESVSWTYPKTRRHRSAFVRISPPQEGTSLTLDVTCSYKGLGELTRQYVFPDNDLLGRVLKARTLGWPGWVGYGAALATAFGWPHTRQILWVRSSGTYMALQEIVDHRAQDLLGALALLCKDGLFAGHVTSVCAGHLADIHVVQEAYSQLVRFAPSQ